MKKFMCLFLLMLLVVIFSGPVNAIWPFGKKDEKGKTDIVEIEFWHTYSDIETEVFEEEIIPVFEKEHPNIKITATRMPYEGLKQQVIAAVSGGAAPDLMRMDIIWVPEFAKLGALEDITDYEGFDKIKSSVFQGPMKTNYYNNRYYGIPLNTNTKVALYNREVMEELKISEPPKTIEELVKLAEELTTKEERWGFGLGGTSDWWVLPYFWTLGGRLTDENYTMASGYLNSKGSIEALETIAKWHNDGLIGPSLLGEQPDLWGGMEGNNYLMIDDGPWFYSIMGEKAEQLALSALLPSGKGGSISVVGGEDLVMFKNSPNKETAWMFARWMLSEYPQKKMLELGLIPTVKKVAETADVGDKSYIKNYIKQLETAKPRVPHPSWEKMSENISLAFESVFRGETDAKTALDEAAELCDQYLGEK